jgi:hypothetical protein
MKKLYNREQVWKAKQMKKKRKATRKEIVATLDRLLDLSTYVYSCLKYAEPGFTSPAFESYQNIAVKILTKEVLLRKKAR